MLTAPPAPTVCGRWQAHSRRTLKFFEGGIFSGGDKTRHTPRRRKISVGLGFHRCDFRDTGKVFGNRTIRGLTFNMRQIIERRRPVTFAAERAAHHESLRSSFPLPGQNLCGPGDKHASWRAPVVGRGICATQSMPGCKSRGVKINLARHGTRLVFRRAVTLSIVLRAQRTG